MIINIMDKTEKIKYQMHLQATSKSPAPSLKNDKKFFHSYKKNRVIIRISSLYMKYILHIKHSSIKSINHIVSRLLLESTIETGE